MTISAIAPKSDFVGLDPGLHQHMGLMNHPDFFQKVWDPEFSEYRKVKDEKFLVDLKEEVNADGENLKYFFTDHGDTASPSEVELLEDFCRDTSLKDVKSGLSSAGNRRVIWIDDRNTGDLDIVGGGTAREQQNPLTPTGLLWALNEPRFNHERLPDAARRLIYVTDLDPSCIHALAATAHCHQVPALRSAIYKHLAFQSSIEVTVPSAGFLNFQLELHLPLFLLRMSKPPKSSIKVNSKPQRQWTALSFLKLNVPKSQHQQPGEVWGLHEAEISYVVTGSDDWRWIGYGFVDTELDGELTDLSELDLSFDRIAAGEIEAKNPLWRPRDHWVKVLDIRIEQVRREWEYLIYKLSHAVNRYMKDHPSNLSRRPGIAQDRTTELKEAFDWALQILSLLRRLDGVLSATVKSWQSFASTGGDIGYFYEPCTDMLAKSKSIKARYRSLQIINARFGRLGEYRDRIAVLNKDCSDYKETLKLRLNLDKKETADQNEFTSVFTLLFLYPVGLAAAIFSMQQEAIPFKQSPRTFVITVLTLIVTVCVTLLLGRYALPPLARRIFAFWVSKSDEMGDVRKVLVQEEDEDAFELLKGLNLGRTLKDEEQSVERACGTRAILGPTVTVQELGSDFGGQ